MASNIVGMAQAAKETGEMAQNVYSAADGLPHESQVLAREVEHFLRGVREA